VRIEAAFLANHVEVHSDTLYVHGGYATHLFVSELPCTRSLPLGLVLELTDEELNDTFALDLRLRGPDGTVLRKTDMSLWLDPDASGVDLADIVDDPAPNFLRYGVFIGGELCSEGLHLLEFARFDELLYTVRFSVVVEEGP
jgi:hypothetical protein